MMCILWREYHLWRWRGRLIYFFFLYNLNAKMAWGTCIRQHTPAYVSIRQHTLAYVSICQHMSAYVSIRQRIPFFLALSAPFAFGFVSAWQFRLRGHQLLLDGR